MIRYWAAGVAALSFAAVLAATNPGAGDHRRVVVESARAGCGDNLLIKALCGNVVNFAATHLSYDDWRLFSIGRLAQMETFGALGHVVVVRE